MHCFEAEPCTIANDPLHFCAAIKVDPPKELGVGIRLEIRKEKASIVHFVGGMAPEGAAAESGQIALMDQLVAVDGKDCSNLDGKQVAALVVGLEGSSVTLDFVRDAPPGHHGDGVDKFQVVLIRGGLKSARKFEVREEEKDAEPANICYDVTLIRGGVKGRERVLKEEDEHRCLVARYLSDSLYASQRKICLCSHACCV